MEEDMKYCKYIALTASMLLSSTVLADDTGVGGADPDSIHDPGKPHIPETSDPSTESTDTWWNDLLELFDFDTSEEE
jgi:hypothetical protein